MPSKNNYKPTLVKLMSYLDGVEYSNDDEFSQDQLGQLTADGVIKWFNVLVLGVESPTFGHDIRPQVRSSTIEYYKKALSHYMPNRLMTWNELSKVGNPTRSRQLNDLIKYVKKKEARKMGAPSKARRSITSTEYREVIKILKSSDDGDIVKKYGMPALMNFQFHMISRIDDSTQAFFDNLLAHDNFDFLLKVRLNWSKNVHEERDAPFQAVIPAMDQMYCTHLALALWLEIFLTQVPTAGLTPYMFGFTDNIMIPKGGEHAKDLVQSIFNSEIFNRQEFVDTGPLGSHSVRKFASSHVRKCGISRDEKDIRGRWKSRRHVSDIYDDVELPFIDAKVAGMLCIGGPCKYAIKEGSGINDAFILQNVMTKTRTRVGDTVAKVLGKALLWYIMDPSSDGDIPDFLSLRVKNAYQYIQLLPENVNPIKKIPVVITGHEGEVYIDEIPENFNEREGRLEPEFVDRTNMVQQARIQGDFLDRPIQSQLLALHSQLMAVRRATDTLNEAVHQVKCEQCRHYQTLNTNLQRIALQPARRQIAAEENNLTMEQENQQAAVAALSPNVKCLYELWHEYQHGIGGRKAARLFTAQERGRVKHKYTRRKVVWDCVDQLVRSGITANAAIDRIYAVYGQSSPVTVIINKLRKDRNENNLHVSLR
jgi:Pre-mRNA cleavage and polyadenylation specificity factor